MAANKLPYQLESRPKQHPLGVEQDEFPAQGRQEMRFAPPRQDEGQHVVPAIEKATIDERGQLPPHLDPQQRHIENAERFSVGKARESSDRTSGRTARDPTAESRNAQ